MKKPLGYYSAGMDLMANPWLRKKKKPILNKKNSRIKNTDTKNVTYAKKELIVMGALR